MKQINKRNTIQVSMTKTLFGKKLLLIATITVLVSGLTLSATLNDAEAKKGPPSGVGHDLKCKKDNVGSFMSFSLLGPFVSTGESKCKFLGHAAFTTVTATTLALGPSSTVNDCILLTGAGPGGFDGYGISKKGFFTFVTPVLEQCFTDKLGTAVPAPGTRGFLPFCGGIATNTWFSTVTGPFVITGGLINDKKDSTPVVGGGGMLTSAVDHCATGTAPGGDSAVTTLNGTIDFP